jgi:DUF4097 and DUF4098 domain-containing protein YvlB
MASTPPPYQGWNAPRNAPGNMPGGVPIATDRRSQRYAQRMQQNAFRQQQRAAQQQARMQRDQYQLRTGSLFGPALLIALGVLALLATTHQISFFAVWPLLARWWPLLLIAAGAIRLAEWAWDRQRLARWQTGDPPVAMHRLSGGAVALLILLCFAGIIGQIAVGTDHRNDLFGDSFSMNSDALDSTFGDQHESSETLTRPLSAGTSLKLSNPHGDVTIAGTSDDQQMHLTLHRVVTTISDSDAARKEHDLEPIITTAGDSMTVALPNVDGGRANLDVTLPAGTNLTATADHGDLTVTSMHADVWANTSHGDIQMNGITGGVTAHLSRSGSNLTAHGVTGPLTVNGSAQDVTASDVGGALTLRGDFFGVIHLQNVAGPVTFETKRTHLALARLPGEVEIGSDADLSITEAAGPLVLSSRNRNVTLDRIAGDVAVANTNGSVTLTSALPLGNINIGDTNGEVTLNLPQGEGFSVQASTRNGSISNDFGLNQQESRTHQSLNGTVGTGGPTIRVATTESDITLRKTVALPLPANASAATSIDPKPHAPLPLLPSPKQTAEAAPRHRAKIPATPQETSF